MTTRPFLARAHEVQAYLAGRLSLVVRPLSPQPVLVGNGEGQLMWVWNKTGRWIVEPTVPEVGACWVQGKNPSDTGAAGIVNDCPCGVPGAALVWKETMWVSDCERYFAQPAYIEGHHHYDVLDREQQTRFLWPRYTPTGWEDEDRRFTHAEFPHMVTAWSVRDGGFELSFSDHDVSIRKESFTGNTATATYSATFSKQYPSTNMPRWAVRPALRATPVVDVRVIQVQPLSVADCYSVGLRSPHYSRGSVGSDHSVLRVMFPEQWDTDNAHRPGCDFASNPWAWVVRITATKGGG